MTQFKKKIIISIVSLVILSILFSVFIIIPLFMEIKEISRNIPLKKQEVAGLEKKLENFNKFKNDLSEISPNIEKIDHLFIDLRAPIEFREFLEQLAQDSKVSLKISPVRSSQAADDTVWSFNPLYLDLEGPFINFSNFLAKLESAPYLIEIKDLSIFSERKISEPDNFFSGNIKAKLLVRVYAR